MKSQTMMLFGFGLVQSVIGISALQSPGCASKCWENSKYVSTCLKANETQCLCQDTEFQSVVLQCLYSQCQTTQFGFALHRTLSACSDSEMDTLDAWPPLVGHKGSRKRGSASSGYPSGHLSASAIHSVARRSVSASAYVSARPTRSAGQTTTHTHDLPKSLPLSISAPSSGGKMNDRSTKTS